MIRNHRPTRLLLATATAVALAATVVQSPAIAGTSDSDYTVTVGATTPFDLGADTPDSAFVDKDGTFHAQTAIAGYHISNQRRWYFLKGHNFDDATVDDTLTNANYDTTDRCNNGPTGVESTPMADPTHPERDYCDLTDVWVDPDTGNWYGLVHNEFTPHPYDTRLNGFFGHFDGIDYAVSTDQGKTWTIKAHVITSPYATKRGDTTAFPQQTYDYGDGDPRLLVDTASGYFYVFYGSRIIDKEGSWKAFHAHVARAPIADKMAPGSWQKWYDGHWSQPGVGGKESNMVPVDAAHPSGYTAPDKEYDPATPGTTTEQVAAGKTPPTSPLFVMDVSYDAYLGLYIGEPQAVDQSGNAPQDFYATDNLATQKWTKIGDTGSYHTASWYRWLADDANGWSSTIIGKQFRAYCTVACGYSDGEYAKVAIDSSSPAAPVEDGATYRIANGAGRELTEVGSSNATTSIPSTGSPLSTWKFTSQHDGSYVVTNAHTGKVLGVPDTTDSTRAWGTRPTATTPAPTPSVGQQWFVVPDTSSTGQPTGSFRLVNRYSGLVLGLSSRPARSAETTPLRDWTAPQSKVGDGRTASEQRLALAPVG